MTNPYGITLDSAWTEWAAKEEVSETVAAAVLLICETALFTRSWPNLHRGSLRGLSILSVARRTTFHLER